MNQCPICTSELAPGQTICSTCANTYHQQLDAIPHIMQILTILAKREAHIGPHIHQQRNRISMDLINWDAAIQRDQLAQWLQITASHLTAQWGLEPLNHWPLQHQRLTANRERLTNLPTAAASAKQLTHIIDRYRRYTTPPATLALVGICPTCPQRTLIYAAPEWTTSTCPTCHQILNLADIRQAYIDNMPTNLHITQTCAGVAKWIKHETGLTITASAIKNLRARGKLTPTHIEGAYWQWQIKQLYDTLIAKK